MYSPKSSFSRWRPFALLVLLAGCATDPMAFDSAEAELGMPLEIARTNNIGALTGNLQVGNDGSAYYDIPIEVVPARNNMQPSLGFHYSSSDSIGEMGRGWSLAGVPSITRCARTVATDGESQPVRYQANDAFCLQGERLIRIANHGSYADYRTENESFQLIRMYRGPLGAERWRVRAPDGQIYWYGLVEQGARRLDSGHSIIAEWMLATVEDSFGNAMQYHWSQPIWPEQSGPRGQFSEVVLERIEYATHNSDLEADREVRFAYGIHAEPRMGFSHGRAWQHSQRLEHVSSWLNDEIVREYRLSYSDDSPSGVSRLTAMTECVKAPVESGATADGEMVCLEPTVFGWSTGESEGSPYEYNSAFTTGYTSDMARFAGTTIRYDDNLVFLDANGDGATDFAYTVDGDLILHLASPNEARPFLTSDAVTTSVSGLADWATEGRYFAVDWNDDGLDDILRIVYNGETSPYEVHILVSSAMTSRT